MGIEHLGNLIQETIAAGKPFDGTTDEAELSYLARLAQSPAIKRIGEIGFNAGFSSYAFLSVNPAARVVSFDLVEYEYVEPAKQLIDQEFPDRHLLIKGDSTQTVPKYRKANPNTTFDVIFIDGGHDYEVARADLNNMKTFATPNTLLVTDDLTPWHPWGIGPTKAWQEAVDSKLVTQIELIKDGYLVRNIEPPGTRSWVLGRYLFE